MEIEDRADVGSISPLLGGQGVRYDPLPAKLSSRRKNLALVYHDGSAVVRLDLSAARALQDASDAAQFQFTTPAHD
ncbi:hypothetical protein [Methylobrevis pamukkalensis]|uniref:Uncharacterized protein n=1 Tax=Methylobrevis pamukkalensis TaxID=1439726 RepID=A0A1E3H020_9HYPH|nr:hypothetical protein [Methylobrevis pamukkalensis]ODN69166.1 hypothetical protein A6302_03542 [Methylobrevis pamukkalensis]